MYRVSRVCRDFWVIRDIGRYRAYKDSRAGRVVQALPALSWACRRQRGFVHPKPSALIKP